MPFDVNHPLSDERIFQVLVKQQLISASKAGEILKRKTSLKEKLSKQRKKNLDPDLPSARIETPVTMIDVIDALNMKQETRPEVALDEEAIYQALAKAWKIPFKKVDPVKLDLNVVTTTIPRNFALKHLMLPIAISEGRLTVATANPFNTEVLEDIARASKLEVNVVVSTRTDILKLIHEFFGFKRSIAAAENQFNAPIVDLGNLEQYVQLKSVDELPSNDSHIVNAVSHLFTYAFDQRASDIHIEPKRDTSMVRMRIDGVLHTVHKIPKKVHPAIVSRIKNLSRIDMAEKRRPQDGRIKTEKEGVEVEIRVSMIPTAFGEKVVMRIMDPDILFQDLDELGFTPTDLIRYNQFVSMPNGIVLVCGPTGSGKSTTLYSTLRSICTPEINITTIEDPIEMVHEDFNQISVNPIVGVTFGSILRNILRQDPDVIMVGEMRDLETAENAIQAALTGHLVLSTLHTNDAPASITRLIELGVPPFLIQATLRGIVSQRLVRKICDRCKEAIQIDTTELKQMGLNIGTQETVTVYRGRGCQHCRGTGYKGRIGIHEVLPYSEAIRKLTTEVTDLTAIREKAIQEGMVSLRENAINMFLAGVTTYQEVMRVTWEQ
ncbi:MAG: type II/IV secretion system protein [Deltaproteobacteria bacterium]|nr:MAG: type II/IV secretion system protein [Deltaproteobacteria bacterium]RLC15890.1 MAG: type II/IV secretion system protein [Deltaproteobacteria bacterium]